MIRRRAAALLAVLALAAGAAPTYADLPTGTDVDNQLGGDRSVPENVGIVVRDRASAPVDGAYNVCYVNGFQTQENERSFWRREHWDLVLKDHGRPVVDGAWGEWVLDTRTRLQRREISSIMLRWTRGCARHGFDAVEYDNLDSFTRSHGLIERRQALLLAEMLVKGAHKAGLEVGQKNLAGYDGTQLGFDFAISEECGRYHECDAYTDDYGDRVIAIEYRRQDFRWTCSHVGDELPVVLRDRNLTPTGVREWC
jgi:hypothetical protein